jgi:LysR family transcriptional regulator, carnitine catabolism transcriptional activator
MKSNVTLRQIEGFLLAAELLSFSRAAESMHITQSAFSQLVRELESSLGVRLFDRTTRRVALTDTGRALFAKMRRGVLEIEDACEEARAIARAEHGNITIGTLASLAIGVVTRSLGEFRKGFPGVKVSMREDYNGPLLERVAQGQVDFAVCAHSESADALDFEPLFEDELVAVMRRADVKTAGPMLRWSALQEMPVIMLVRDSSTHEQVAAALAANRIHPERDYEVANMFTALSMVRAGFGVTFIPAMVLREVNLAGLAWRRLRGPVPVRRIGICRRKDRTPSPAAAKFEHLLRAEVQRTRERTHHFYGV